MKRPFILFLIIFLEGYVVLSTELLAIRQLIPFVGSGTDTISIIIAAVLMPLAFGYYAGGQYKTRRDGRHRGTVRNKLIYNLLVSAVILTAGLSYPVLRWLFETAGQHLFDRLWLTALYAAVFLVYPVFLLGQTVPLISNYFPGGRLPVMAGRIMFFSTLGSFMGAVFCTLVLMAFIGVHYTVAVTIASLAVLVLMLARRPADKEALAALACVAAALWLNSGHVMAGYDVVLNNQHHMVQVEDYGYMKAFRVNHNMSSGISNRTGKSDFKYIQFMERTFIDTRAWNSAPPMDILVVGAGGFTIGKTDRKNSYVYVDLDKDLKTVAEDKFLGEALSDNKQFVAMPIRAYLQQNDQKFDLILIDLFRGPSRTPEHLVTQEFFEQIRDALKPGGIMTGNYVVSPTFSDIFSVRLDNTIRSVFPNVSRQVIPDYDGWDPHFLGMNVIYSYHHNPDMTGGIYTDNLNKSVLDKPKPLNR